MENRKFIKISLVIALLQTLSLTFPGRVFGYEVQTHAGITKEVVEFYNKHFPSRVITSDETALMMSGAVHEDDAPRWLNHYYDPVYDRGLTNPLLGGEGEWLSSKAWVQNGKAQIAALYNPFMLTTSGALSMLTDPEQETATDYSWERAIRDYASGDTERAFRGLGQVIHLLEDASVPDHTRNDTHIGIEGVGGLFGEGSPYELWTGQFDENNAELSYLLYGKKPIVFPTLNEYFDSLALYSNKNFYSKDTIDSPEYAEPKPDYVLKLGEYYYGYKKDIENGDYKLIFYEDYAGSLLDNAEKNAGLKDPVGDLVMRDYWERLAPKAVQHAAGAIDLFFKEAEKLKNDPNFKVEKRESVLGQVISAIKKFFEEKTDGGFENLAEIKLDGEDLNINKGEIAASSASRRTPRNDGIQGKIASPLVSDPAVADVVNQPNFNYPEGKMTGSRGEIASSGTPRNDKSEDASGAADESGAVCEYNNPSTSSGNNHSIIINEVAWAGTEVSTANEWIELRNISGNAVNLDGYYLLDKEAQINIVFPPDLNLAPGDFLLLERTDDESVPGISADMIYVGALSNSDEGLRLFDKKCILLDEALADPDWSAGSFNPKRTMERQTDLSWRTYSGSGENGIFGTPRAANTEGVSSVGSGNSSMGSENNSGNNSGEIAAPSPLPPAVLAGHIVISEISAGVDGNAEYEFVELYNPTDAEVDLVGWVLKKKSSSGSESNLVSSGSFIGKIAPKSFFLIAHPSYAGVKTADLKYSATSQNLAYSNNSAVLYDATGAKVDEASWENIEKGQSIERKAVSGSECVSTQGGGQFLGNGCDTGATADFETRAVPDPQNKNSLPEPRAKPAAASDFGVRFYPATAKAVFSWATTTDATGSTTQIYIIEGVASTTNVGHTQSFNEIGREYSYSIVAQDRDGLASDAVNISTTTQSFIKDAKFYDNPINAGEKIIDIYFEKYPFVANPINTGSTWNLLVLGLNSAPPRGERLDTPMNWEPENKEGVMKLFYQNSVNEYPARYSLILPDTADRDFGGGVANSSYKYSRIIDDNLIRLRVGNASPLTGADYFQTSFYDFWGGGAGNQTFKFIFSDATKFYFTGGSNNLPPTTPGAPRIQSLATSTNQLFVSWIRSVDPDGEDIMTNYQFNFVTSTSGAPEVVFDESAWKKPWLGATEVPERIQTMQEVVPGNYYIFGFRAIDEFGATSSIAVTEAYLTP